MKTAVIYARYSSNRQTEQSIEGQVDVCEKYARQNDITIVDQYIDRAMTGTNDKRTAFQRMLKDSSKKIWNYVLVYKIDRFGRNKYEIAINKHTLKQNNVKLVSVMENIPDTPEGIILESVLEGMAEYYSSELSQKVKRGMSETRKKGNFMGGLVPYGYKVENKKILINSAEAEIVKKIYTEYANGKLVVDIRQELLDMGIKNRNREFARNTLYNLLKSEKYAGIYTFNGEVYTNLYPRIIPNELFEIVRIKVQNNKYGKHKPDIVYLLKNKLVCGYCGNTVNSDAGTSSTGKVMRYYKCTGKRINGNCQLKPYRKEYLEDLIVSAIISVLKSNELVNDIAEKVILLHNNKTNEDAVINLLYKEKEQIDTSIQNIMNAMDKGIITTSTKEHLENLELQKTDIAEKIARENNKQRLVMTKEDVIKNLKNAVMRRPRLMIETLVKKIVLYNDKVEIYFNYNKQNNDDDKKGVVFADTKNIQTSDGPKQMEVKILMWKSCL